MKPTLSILLVIVACAVGGRAIAQNAVTEIVTDYNGYWKSSSASINPVKPNNSHNLVSFSFNGQRYSTGVNDALLTNKGLSFVAGQFKALPMQSITGTVNGNTKIGLGEMYDGVSNGASNPAPVNSIPKYLTDGIRGLDIGTCVANLPAGNMYFPATNLHLSSIGDNIPDLLITQVADPAAGSFDRYEFTDISGNRIGNYVDIVLSNISTVGNWTADFYEASANPMQLNGGFTKTDRPIRLWAADFSAFGINASNIARVAYFKITLNGNSDVAFVAYNEKAIDVSAAALPVLLTTFQVAPKNGVATVQWETSKEIQTDRFVIEVSGNNKDYREVASLQAKGYSDNLNRYEYKVTGLTNGTWYFRLKMIDQDGTVNFSPIQVVKIESGNASQPILKAYPNPAIEATTVQHPSAAKNDILQVVNMQGNVVASYSPAIGSQSTRLTLSLPNGAYLIRYVGQGAQQTGRLVIQK